VRGVWRCSVGWSRLGLEGLGLVWRKLVDYGSPELDVLVVLWRDSDVIIARKGEGIFPYVYYDAVPFLVRGAVNQTCVVILGEIRAIFGSKCFEPELCSHVGGKA
jgi:hypothetical protein